MSIVLGVDGGASKTHAVVMDRLGNVLGFGKAGTSNHQIFGLKPALAEIQAAVEAALDEAGQINQVDVGCFCLAGADLEEDYVMLQTAVEELNIAKKVIIKNDTLAALHAGLIRTWGVAVICGTGFNAIAVSPDGREIVLPGLGAMSGDWGGGGDLSIEMIRAVMRAWDGRDQSTLLTELVLHELDVPSVEALLHWLYSKRIQRSHLAKIVPCLFQAAESGDEVATELIVRLGKEVGVTANALIRRLNLNQTDVEVVLGGSVFKGQGDLLINTVKRVVQIETPGAQIKRLNCEPVMGAALLGLKTMGVSVDDSMLVRFQTTLNSSLKNRL